MRKTHAIRPRQGVTGRMPVVPSSQESRSAIVQLAVKDAGDLQRCVNQLWDGWDETTLPGGRVWLQEAIEADRREIEVAQAADPEGARVTALRAAVNHHVTELRDLVRDIESSSRSIAHRCLMEAMAGEPYWIALLTVHAAP